MSRLTAPGAIPLDTTSAPSSALAGAPAGATGGGPKLKADNKTLALAGGAVLVGVVLYEKFVGGSSTSTPASTLDTSGTDLAQLTQDIDNLNALLGAGPVNMSKTPTPAPVKKVPPKPKPVKKSPPAKHPAPKPRPAPHPAPKPPPKKRRLPIKRRTVDGSVDKLTHRPGPGWTPPITVGPRVNI